MLRCAELTFTAYAPACSCGWRGPLFPATDVGHLDSRRVLVHEHLVAAPARRRRRILGDTVLA